MLNSLPLFVGLRYVRARSHKFFVSFITWVSLLCVCLGVMALIVILSVMNGLEGELRDRLLSRSAHARIFMPARPRSKRLRSTLTHTPILPHAHTPIQLRLITIGLTDHKPILPLRIGS